MLAALLRIVAALLGLFRRPSAEERAARAEERLRQEEQCRQTEREVAERIHEQWRRIDEDSKKQPRVKPGDNIFGRGE